MGNWGRRKILEKMRRIFGILLFAVVIVLFSSCNNKERKLRKEFVGKIWIVDEARRMAYHQEKGELVSMSDYWCNILKPENVHI